MSTALGVWITVVALVVAYTLALVTTLPKGSASDRIIIGTLLAVNAWILVALIVWLRP